MAANVHYLNLSYICTFCKNSQCYITVHLGNLFMAQSLFSLSAKGVMEIVFYNRQVMSLSKL